VDGELRKDGERRETGTKRCPTEYKIHKPRPLALQDATKRILIERGCRCGENPAFRQTRQNAQNLAVVISENAGTRRNYY
jgi:hypothetical protein